MKQLKLISIILVTLLVITGCDKKNPTDDSGRTSFVKGESVFVLNEGEFQSGNGSISHYNKATDSIENGVFETVNRTKLGDIVQSMSIINGKGYIVVNNSEKVVVTGLDSLKQEGLISGLSSPRYIFKVDNNKAYITDLFSDSIAVVDLQSEMITGKIFIKGWNGEMLKYQDHVFIANNGDEHVYVVDSQKDSVINKLSLAPGSKFMVFDSDQDLWVLCEGNSSFNIPSRLFEIDPNTFNVKNGFVLTGNAATELEVSPDGTQLYYFKDGVRKMSTSATQVPSGTLIRENGRILYALGVDPDNGEVYIGDAGNFSDPGMVYRYTSDGNAIDSFQVGIAPGYIQFY